MQLGFMQALSAGPVPNPTYVEGDIGPAFMTPTQAAFKATRKKFGSDDDQDAGGYSVAQVDWDKDNGTCEVGPMEATSDGWYGPG
jgi:hypothetical protein